MFQRKLSSTGYPILFLMVSSTDHVTPKTGAAPSVTLSKNGAAFAAAAGSVSEVGNGWYSLAGNATDRSTLGSLAIRATGTGADSTNLVYSIVSFDPFASLFDESNGVDANLTIREALRLMVSVLAGVVTGANTSSVHFKSTDGSKTRVQASVNSTGRTSVTYDKS